MRAHCLGVCVVALIVAGCSAFVTPNGPYDGGSDVSTSAPDAATGCPVDLAAALGTRCSVENQSCGGPCADACQFCNLVTCREGTWRRVEVPPLPCFDAGSDARADAPIDAHWTCAQTPESLALSLEGHRSGVIQVTSCEALRGMPAGTRSAHTVEAMVTAVNNNTVWLNACPSCESEVRYALNATSARALGFARAIRSSSLVRLRFIVENVAGGGCVTGARIETIGSFMGLTNRVDPAGITLFAASVGSVAHTVERSTIEVTSERTYCVRDGRRCGDNDVDGYALAFTFEGTNFTVVNGFTLNGINGRAGLYEAQNFRSFQPASCGDDLNWQWSILGPIR